MKKIKKFLNGLFTKTKWKSKIKTIYGSQYRLSDGYEELIDNPNIRVTSVSVTRASHAGHKDYGNDCTYLMAVSYDYSE